MPDILHRVGMQGSPAQVYEAIATAKGLSHWWITGITGETSVGGVVKVRPEGGGGRSEDGFDMRVIESKPGEVVRWQCEGGPPEWLGTQLTFRLLGKGAETYVLFTHAGWKDPVEFMHHWSTKWAVFLMSLKDWIERAEGRPHPYDVKIHPRD
jgi:uncharacterized protein YndB with AHSA1/START domain